MGPPFTSRAGDMKLSHWGRVTHICVAELTIIVSDNGLSPGRRQAIIWTNPGILLIGPYGTNFSEILEEILTFSFKKMRLKCRLRNGGCVAELTIIVSDNGLSPGRRQAIIWTNPGILLIGPYGTNFSEILEEILTFSFKKMRLKCRLRIGGHFVSASIC